MFWATAVVIGRILAESGSPPPEVEDQALLFIKRQDVTVGCTPGDAGPSDDAAIDAPGDADTGDANDGGLADAGVDDAGVPDAGTCTSIHDAITMVVQPHVSTTADGTRFAILLVTPERPVVELSANVFHDLAVATAPRVEIETIEVPDKSLGTKCATYSVGCGGGYSHSVDAGTTWYPPSFGDAGLGDGGLVEETIGPYQFVRTQPTSSSELATWLDELGYAYMPADLDAVAPYIALGWHVVAIRVSLDHPQTAAMTSVALTWQGTEIRVPAALGRGAVSPGTLTVYVAADGRYDFAAANVSFAGYTSDYSVSYLTRSELTLDQNAPPTKDPIASGTYGDYWPVTVIKQEVHVPVTVECDRGGFCRNGCGECNAKPQTRFDLLSIVLAIGFVLRRRRR